MPSSIEKSNQKSFPGVQIRSKADTYSQPAIFHGSESRSLKPLIVSLHSWSRDYTAPDFLARRVADAGWNYIRPDFRGPNTTKDACGSALVVSDIEDAVDYAMENAPVDPTQIHLFGGSGGGHAALLCYMRMKRRISSFSAWNPITNLVDWYYESIGRGREYAEHIYRATSSTNGLNRLEALRRSPVFWDYPGEIRDGAELWIYHGIHDGHIGQVPITHSLLFFNELIKKMDPSEEKSLIPEQDVMDLIVKRCYPGTLSSKDKLGDRKVHYKRDYGNTHLLIFDGGHELLHDVVFDQIPARAQGSL